MNETYRKYLIYVKEYLTQHEGLQSPNPLHPFRSRFQHTIRVLHWCLRLSQGLKNVDCDLLCTAAIFHDIGYSSRDNERHAVRSVQAFHAYAAAQGMEEEFARKVERLIARHSDKSLLKEPDTELEMILLLEADLLDEEGAMGIVWDCMTMGNLHASSYARAYYHIMESSNKEEPNPMVTERAKAIWEEKKEIVAKFVKLLEDDLMIGSEYFKI
ncbi:HD domain-containing protein [Lachnospiraceae bacterium 45-W7]